MASVVLLDNVSSEGPGGQLDCRGSDKALLLISGDFDAAIKFEGSLDGVNWFSFIGHSNGGPCSAVIYSPGYMEFKVESVAYLRPVIRDYKSGSVTVMGYVETRRTGNYLFYRFNAVTAGTLIKSGPGTMYSVSVGDPGSAMEITLYDGTSTAGTVISVIKPTSSGSFLFNVELTNGLYLAVTATTMGDVTISYV